MKQLKNVKHDFDVEVGSVGVTLRKGFKWATAPRGEELELWECSIAHEGDCPARIGGRETCTLQGVGTVEGRWVGTLKSLPAKVIELEHEPSSRVYSGLLASLRRAYGPLMPEGEYFTALFYRRTSGPAREEV